LIHHPPLSAFTGSLALVLDHDGSINQGLQIMVWHSNQVRLQVFLKSIHEALPLLLISVDVIRGIPPLGGELVEVLGDTHTSLLEVKELVAHDLDESRWDVGLAELGLEGFPSHHLALGLHGTDVLPPCTCCAS
jgi:hypothetical protein